jgi:hypothetical protein
VVLAKLKSLLSDSNLANKSGIILPSKSTLRRIEELYCLLQISELPGYIDGNE